MSLRNRNRNTVFNELLTDCIPVCLFLFVFPSANVVGQSHASTVEQLKGGIVIFVIPTASEKITYLYAAAESASSPKQATKLRSRAEDTQLEVDSFSIALRRAVEKHFGYTIYEFVPDSLLKARISENGSENLFFVKRGKTESGADALILYDRDFKPLQRPIPYYARLTRLSSIFDAFFGTVKYGWRDMDEVIRKWSGRLEKIE